MAAAVYSTRFLAGQISSTSTLTYTVPDGYRAILRDLDVTGPVGEQVVLVNVTADAAIFFSAIQSSGTVGWLSWRGRQVCEPGDEIQLYAEQTTSASATLSGYLLTLP